MVASLARIAHLSRSKDWRLTFIPFILGCVYLWLVWFRTPFSIEAMTLIALSLITAIGFAALGYSINEYFDQDDDARAGKLNRMALAPIQVRIGLLIAATIMALLPWMWLPSNPFSWLLIAAELNCFALYSFPVFRLKNVPFVANSIDMAYAYTIPMLLSFHTYSLFHVQSWPKWLWPLVACVSLIGLRGIIIHQVDDLFNDKRAGIRTLPLTIGPRLTSLLLACLMFAEILSFLMFAFMFSWIMPWWAASIVVSYAVYLAFLTQSKKGLLLAFLPLAPQRHATDQFYQIIFPMLMLVLVAFSNPWWAILIPLHIGVLVPLHVQQQIWHNARNAANRLYYMGIRKPMNATVNYSIYYGFLIVGVNLKKENSSAAQYLKSRFQR
jgi:4-hydroxybenzoate polyprenyltransferase